LIVCDKKCGSCGIGYMLYLKLGDARFKIRYIRDECKELCIHAVIPREMRTEFKYLYDSAVIPRE
jgi:hypothetical protein